MKITSRATEQISPALKGLDTWGDERILDVLMAGQRRALAAVERALPEIAAAAELLAGRLRTGGRLAYAGAGTSIRLAVLDGSELPCTFGMDERRIVYCIAGGREAMFDTLASAEDDADAARQAVAELAAGDTLIAVAASGSTPYTVAAARTAKQQGAAIIVITNNEDTALADGADVAIVLDSGPEVIAGSTRMAAGTAQKAALNLLSTLAHIRLGAVHDGLMVNVEAGNAKLRARAEEIVAAISQVPQERAAKALALSGGQAKPAVLLCLGARSLEQASHLLESVGGNLRLAMQRLAGP